MPTQITVHNILFDDRFSGPSKRILLVDRRARELGIHTSLVLPEGQGNAEELAREAGVPVHRLAFGRIPRPRDWHKVVGWMLSLPIDIFRFQRFFRRNPAHIVHVSGAFFVAPAIAAKLAGIPLVWHLNDVIVPRAFAPLLGALVRLLANRVVVSSRAAGAHYGVPASNSTLLYPPVDVAAIQPSEHRGRLLEDDGPIHVGLIANWNPIKGVDNFVQATGLLHRHLGERLRVVFAGARLANHPEYRRRVETLIDELGLRPVVIDHGFVPDVSGVLKDLDIATMSSTSEAVSMVVLEGMAAGLPVVATDVGGVKELLLADPQQPAGVVVPPSDPEAMAEAMLELVRDPQRARAMGEMGRRLAEECYSIQAAADRHREVYGQALGRSVGEPGEQL